MSLRDRLDAWFDGAISPKLRDSIDRLDVGQNAQGFDRFGFQPDFLRYVVPPVEWLYRNYFRVETFGLEHIPKDGPVLLISNHSGQIPIDGLMISSACLLDLERPRMVRSMVERWVAELPFASWFYPRVGQVIGTRNNARKLLATGGTLLVFPEGVRGISKTYDKAYELQEFGLGFMRLALETGTPIVPVGVVGCEEQMPAVANLERVGAFLGAPAFPITPTPVPLPVKIRLHFGEPIRVEGAHDDEDRIIRAHVRRVQDAISSLLDEGLKAREGVFV